MKLKIDLVRLIQLAASQVQGGDERAILYQFLARNKDAQLVEVDLGQVLVAGEEEEAGHVDGGPCPYCGNPDPERTVDYTWCPACNSGLFFRACPICGGSLDASLDPLATCIYCGQRWGSPVGAVISAVEFGQPGLIDLPTGLKTLAELLEWLAGLTPPEQ
jgi:hypothetical protein